MDAAVTAGVLSPEQYQVYLRAEVDLESQHIARVSELELQLDFAAAAAEYDTVKQLNADLVGVIDAIVQAEGAKAEPDTDLIESLTGDRVSASFLAGMTEAMALVSMGQSMRTTGHPGAAVEQYQQGAARLELIDLTDAPAGAKAQVRNLGATTEYLIPFAEGLQSYLSLDYAEARIRFARAKVKAEEVADAIAVDTDLSDDERAQLLTRVRSDAVGADALYHQAYVRELLTAENYGRAARESKLAAERTSETAATFAQLFPGPLARLADSEHQAWVGFQRYAEGQVQREHEDWDGALQRFEEARQAWEQAGETALRSNLPQGRAQQELLMNQASLMVDAAVKRCEREQDLRLEIRRLEDEIASLKESIAGSLRQAGVTVQQTNSAQLSSTVTQQLQVVQVIEQRARDSVKELLSELDKLDIDPGAKESIRSEGDEILAAPEAGRSFLDRVKGFVGHVKDIVGGMGEAVGPLLPIIQALSLLA